MSRESGMVPNGNRPLWPNYDIDSQKRMRLFLKVVDRNFLAHRPQLPVADPDCTSILGPKSRSDRQNLEARYPVTAATWLHVRSPDAFSLWR